jgi:hypothetical protein
MKPVLSARFIGLLLFQGWSRVNATDITKQMKMMFYARITRRKRRADYRFAETPVNGRHIEISIQESQYSFTV